MTLSMLQRALDYLRENGVTDAWSINVFGGQVTAMHNVGGDRKRVAFDLDSGEGRAWIVF